MNERIEKFIDDAKLTAVSEMFESELEKFAELIVEECLEACSRANETRHLVPPTQQQVVLDCMCEIESEFGVRK